MCNIILLTNWLSHQQSNLNYYRRSNFIQPIFMFIVTSSLTLRLLKCYSKFGSCGLVLGLIVGFESGTFQFLIWSSNPMCQSPFGRLAHYNQMCQPPNLPIKTGILPVFLETTFPNAQHHLCQFVKTLRKELKNVAATFQPCEQRDFWQKFSFTFFLKWKDVLGSL